MAGLDGTGRVRVAFCRGLDVPNGVRSGGMTIDDDKTLQQTLEVQSFTYAVMGRIVEVETILN